MTRVLLASTALLALATAASAADLPMRAAPPAPPPVAPVFTWTGFYVGIHGAWIRNDVDVSRTRTNIPCICLPRRADLYDSGLGGGGQVGYLMQFGSFVAGLEADITAADIGRTRTIQGSAGPATATARFSSDMGYFGTVKGRLGVTFPSFLPFFQQSMVYVTGGLGYADVDNRVRVRVTVPGLGSSSAADRSDDTKVGFVVGGGTESAITNTISLKTETVYYNLDDDQLTARRGRGRVGYRFENDGWISKVGLNLRF